MRSVLVSAVCVTVLVVISTGVDAVRCPDGWTYIGASGTCVKLHHDSPHVEVPWHEARRICQANNADLVKVINQKMNDALNALIHGLVYRKFWLGLNEILPEGKYVWLDETKEATYTNWNIHEPVSLEPGRHCALSFGENWVAWPCGYPARPICERATGECDPGYYGEGCAQTCSEHCAGVNNSCHHGNGTCDRGCDPGYQGDLCTQELPPLGHVKKDGETNDLSSGTIVAVVVCVAVVVAAATVAVGILVWRRRKLSTPQSEQRNFNFASLVSHDE